MSERFDYIVETDYIKKDGDTISFAIQNGPIRENGLNGCQVDDMIIVATSIIRKLNGEFPCRENSLAITKLEEAIHWLNARTKDRESRGVEGKNIA